MSYELGLVDCTEFVCENVKIGLLAYDFDRNVLWVKGKMKHDKSWTSPQRKKSIVRSLEEFNKCCFFDELVNLYPWTLDLVLESVPVKELEDKVQVTL